MKVRVSRFLTVGAILIAVNLPIAASALTRDIERPGPIDRIVRIIKVIKKILKVSPQEEWPGAPKP
jgi:hypothetical protein